MKDFGDNLPAITEALTVIRAKNTSSQLTVPIACLWSICMAFGGYTKEARKELESLMTNHSQSPLVQGALFQVHAIVHPESDRYTLRDKFCPKPFIQLDVLENSTYLCCASYLSVSSGDMKENDWYDVWNSKSSQKVRESIFDGSYRYCAKFSCPAIQSQSLKTFGEQARLSKRWSDIINHKKTELEVGPGVVNLSYDRTCNLSCPSCRTHPIVASTATVEQFDLMQERNIYPLLRSANKVLITGAGDPFASKTYRKLLKWISNANCPDLKVCIMSNGMLFTEKEWRKYPNLKGKVQMVKISIDGASKQTHENLRRGSLWERMLENMIFIGDLRVRKEIDNFELVFTVQQENFREMGEAIDLAKRVGANSVYFGRLTNWGTFSDEEYKEKAVFMVEHRDHETFLECMKDPRLKESYVISGDLSRYIQ